MSGITAPITRVGLSIAISAIFVFCWASGYLAARFTKDLFAPFNLLLVRYVTTVVVLLGIVWWKNGLGIWRAIANEATKIQFALAILYHVIYIGCVFYAVKLGLSAGIAAVILATQPLLTILIECAMKHVVPSGQHLLGGAICIFGTALLAGIGATGDLSAGFLPLTVAGIGVLAISIATSVHARFVHEINLWPSLLFQFTSATVAVTILVGLGVEPLDIRINYYSISVVFLLVFITTIGSYVSMNWLVANIDTDRYSLLFYVVPPFVFIVEFIVFESYISISKVLGFVLVLIGVFISINGKYLIQYFCGERYE